MGGRTVQVVLGCAVLLGGSAGVAAAVPPAPPPPPCSFALSTVRAGDSVVATVESTGCAALAAPYTSVVCLQSGVAPARCSQAHGTDPARIAVPYAPGRFIASGRGCAGLVGLPPAADCQSLGPDAVTL